MKVSEQTVLGVGPARAWSLLIDWEAQAGWMKDADLVLVLGDLREGPGVRLAVKTRVFGVPLFTEKLEVIEWNPPHRLLMAHRSFVGGTGEWSLSQERGGSSTFRWTEDLSLRIPVFGELALALYRPFMRRLMKGSLAGFQSVVAREAT